jgi:Nitroreductase family
MIHNKGKNETPSASSQDVLPIKLPRPILDDDKSLLKALQQRKTVREISDKKISSQILSNLLWAAYGVNRKKGPFGTPGRTAASASNSQEIDVYVALPEGIYLYDAFHHRLLPVVAGDLRTLAIGKSYYYVDTGLIAGNVYLFAASHGLASWFHNCNKTDLAANLKLRPDQRILFAQTVGHPIKK